MKRIAALTAAGAVVFGAALAMAVPANADPLPPAGGTEVVEDPGTGAVDISEPGTGGVEEAPEAPLEEPAENEGLLGLGLLGLL